MKARSERMNPSQTVSEKKRMRRKRVRKTDEDEDEDEEGQRQRVEEKLKQGEPRNGGLTFINHSAIQVSSLYRCRSLLISMLLLQFYGLGV